MLIRLLLTFILALGLCGMGHTSDDKTLVIVANPNSGITELKQDDIINLFMGRFKKLPSGITALPVDYMPARADFYQVLVNKSLAEVNSYWARLVFSGRAFPPQQLETANDVIETVANNRGAIGYIPRDQVDERVKVIGDLSSIVATQ